MRLSDVEANFGLSGLVQISPLIYKSRPRGAIQNRSRSCRNCKIRRFIDRQGCPVSGRIQNCISALRPENFKIYRDGPSRCTHPL